MGAKFSGLGKALYDSKRREFLGRDGVGWGKLGTFYFFFYLGLAGFFCAMLAVFMLLSPRDAPRYYSESSRMATRSNPLTPGLGFRPQPDVEKNIIYAHKNGDTDADKEYVDSLNQYLEIFYPEQVVQAKKVQPAKDDKDDNDDDDDDDDKKQPFQDDRPQMQPFKISNPGDCTSGNKYGYASGKPCVLVKMNKIVGFQPEAGASSEDKAAYKSTGCANKDGGIAIHCSGEYAADADSIGNITYFSESGTSDKCGYLSRNRFPYEGKVDRRDVYQAPYIWVQLTNPKPNTLINVLCRAYGKNIYYDKKTGRALTRFQIYVEDLTKRNAPKKSRKNGDM